LERKNGFEAIIFGFHWEFAVIFVLFILATFGGEPRDNFEVDKRWEFRGLFVGDLKF
jgi:hypothetical protein